jgi:ABC-type transport system involved in cytochrome bd biosynthesis fused ATPase/permease subunit
VSVRIEPGQRVAVVGATGSGKSTFARLVARLADATDGTVEVAGVDVRRIADTDLRRLLLLVPQEPFLLCWCSQSAVWCRTGTTTISSVPPASTPACMPVG